MITKRQTIGFRYEDGWIQTEADIEVTGLFRKKYKLSLYDKKIKNTEEYIKIRKALGDKMTEKEQRFCAKVLIAENTIQKYARDAWKIAEAHAEKVYKSRKVTKETKKWLKKIEEEADESVKRWAKAHKGSK